MCDGREIVGYDSRECVVCCKSRNSERLRTFRVFQVCRTENKIAYGLEFAKREGVRGNQLSTYVKTNCLYGRGRARFRPSRKEPRFCDLGYLRRVNAVAHY